MTAKAWIDPNTRTIMFRGDVPLDEAVELRRMLRAAFNAGLAAGYADARKGNVAA